MDSNKFLTDRAAYWYWNGPYLISAEYNTCLTQNQATDIKGNVVLSPIGTSPRGNSSQIWNQMDTYKITITSASDLLYLWQQVATVYAWAGNRPNEDNSRWYKY
jgi:hypothetical protein